MNLDLKIPWRSKDVETLRTTGFEFYGIRDQWNQHNQGVLYWLNVNVVNLTSTGTTVLKGTTTNDSAATGNIGEYVEGLFSGVSFPASGTIGDAKSISLTAGDWDASLNVLIERNGSTFTDAEIGIGFIAGNNDSDLVIGNNRMNFGVIAATVVPGSIPAYRISIASTTTVYVKFESAYAVATPKLDGRISARRVR